jgi:hypothetical protein
MDEELFEYSLPHDVDDDDDGEGIGKSNFVPGTSRYGDFSAEFQ